MTSIKDSRLISILPPNLQLDEEAISFCYALDNQIKKIIDLCGRLDIWSDIENAWEPIVDYLSVEMRTQFYDKTLPVEVKRTLVSSTMPWYEKSGTDEVVKEVITHAFGDGEIKEWYEYGGEVGHFKVITSDVEANGEKEELFLSILDSVKRKTSKLDGILVTLTGQMDNFYGIGIHEVTKETYKIAE
ncbi:MAG: phage tail protein [Velocimicrobium sp.]